MCGVGALSKGILFEWKANLGAAKSMLSKMSWACWSVKIAKGLPSRISKQLFALVKDFECLKVLSKLNWPWICADITANSWQPAFFVKRWYIFAINFAE